MNLVEEDMVGAVDIL